jgi:aspartyl-tRNA(Asn)/glutamyl-tRNA(Gln) amidotransferase subunit A
MRQDRRDFESDSRRMPSLLLGTQVRASQVPRRPDDLTGLSLSDASDLLDARKVSPVELTKACLARIERLNPSAERLHHRNRRTGARGCEKPQRPRSPAGSGGDDCTASRSLKASSTPPASAPLAAPSSPIGASGDAEVVRRLRAAGAVILGKLNMHEFAYGDTSAQTHYGPVHNPWQLEHIAGGSSGGSGAAVAAGLCYGAMGSDTGGSIRQPAAYCGIVGLKPTYGLVSTRGVVPLSWRWDHVGALCRTVADTALPFNRSWLRPARHEQLAATVPGYPAGRGSRRPARNPHDVLQRKTRSGISTQ